jgi:uncharacterized protein YhhL (DUF1145 family)
MYIMIWLLGGYAVLVFLFLVVSLVRPKGFPGLQRRELLLVLAHLLLALGMMLVLSGKLDQQSPEPTVHGMLR